MRLWHRHKWRAVTASGVEFAIVHGVGTIVLYVCDECGANKTESLNGLWTLDQLKGS